MITHTHVAQLKKWVGLHMTFALESQWFGETMACCFLSQQFLISCTKAILPSCGYFYGICSILGKNCEHSGFALFRFK